MQKKCKYPKDQNTPWSLIHLSLNTNKHRLHFQFLYTHVNELPNLGFWALFAKQFDLKMITIFNYISIQIHKCTQCVCVSIYLVKVYWTIFPLLCLAVVFPCQSVNLSWLSQRLTFNIGNIFSLKENYCDPLLRHWGWCREWYIYLKGQACLRPMQDFVPDLQFGWLVGWPPSFLLTMLTTTSLAFLSTDTNQLAAQSNMSSSSFTPCYPREIPKTLDFELIIVFTRSSSSSSFHRSRFPWLTNRRFSRSLI